MKTRFIFLAIFLAGALAVSAPLFAHHGYAAYDMINSRSLKGTITSYALANPHTQISFDVKDASGNVEHWAVETGLPVRGMRAIGFTSESLKPGDEVTINFHPAKESIHAGVLISVAWPDGHILPAPEKPAGDQPK
jgi:hypothetical protein